LTFSSDFSFIINSYKNIKNMGHDARRRAENDFDFLLS
jgi:hypothetical protein